MSIWPAVAAIALTGCNSILGLESVDGAPSTPNSCGEDWGHQGVLTCASGKPVLAGVETLDISNNADCDDLADDCESPAPEIAAVRQRLVFFEDFTDHQVDGAFVDGTQEPVGLSDKDDYLALAHGELIVLDGVLHRHAITVVDNVEAGLLQTFSSVSANDDNYNYQCMVRRGGEDQVFYKVEVATDATPPREASVASAEAPYMLHLSTSEARLFCTGRINTADEVANLAADLPPSPEPRERYAAAYPSSLPPGAPYKILVVALLR